MISFLNNGKVVVDQRKNWARRVLLVLCLVVLAVLYWSAFEAGSANSVYYGKGAVTTIRPIEPMLCPGDALRFPVHVEIMQYPDAAISINQWCRAGVSGVCANSLATWQYVGLLQYRSVDAISSRPIPDHSFFTPGDYEYWHTSTSLDGSTVTGYIVPFTIKPECK